ncbi:methyl-accepting chemotaxis protein [Modestobacter sp. NPDC049651]|uniref:methyl-accepting chemotaxis protein n=1 Tax=unclassified Modestobacter TaxID=2643866 RepID=UPI0033C9FE1B
MDDLTPSDQPGGRSLSALGRIGLGGRLLAAILLVALTTLAVGIIGANRMGSLSDKAEQVYANGTVPLDGLREMQSGWWEVQAQTARSAITSLTPEQQATSAKAAAAALASLQKKTAAVADMPLPAGAQGAYEKAAAAVADYVVQSGRLSKLGPAGPASPDFMDILNREIADEAAIEKNLPIATSAAKATATATADAAHDAYVTARTWTWSIVAAGLLVSVVLAALLVRSITRPVQRVREVLDRVADGDLSVRAGATGGAEIGQVAESLDRTLDSLGSVLSLVNDSAGRLAGASQKLTAGADAIADNARTAAGQADVVVASAAEVASSVDTVATGSSQMESAIREIAHNATEASRVAGQAVGVAEETTRMVGKLGDSSQEIAAVVKLINGIAEQTNLLALNATIEAARAGEAGKGFAVVASEVKELAQETARATEDISQRVAAIQADTAGAVEAIGQISTVIAEINDFQSTIAAAVEEQTATTNEMNRNVAEAAGSSRSIAQAITGLATGTQATNDRVAEAQQSASELARMSDELQSAVGRFTV